MRALLSADPKDNGAAGELVPIPTRPALSMRMRSEPEVVPVANVSAPPELARISVVVSCVAPPFTSSFRDDDVAPVANNRAETAADCSISNLFCGFPLPIPTLPVL